MKPVGQPLEVSFNRPPFSVYRRNDYRLDLPRQIADQHNSVSPSAWACPVSIYFPPKKICPAVSITRIVCSLTTPVCTRPHGPCFCHGFQGKVAAAMMADREKGTRLPDLWRNHARRSCDRRSDGFPADGKIGQQCAFLRMSVLPQDDFRDDARRVLIQSQRLARQGGGGVLRSGSSRCSVPCQHVPVEHIGSKAGNRFGREAVHGPDEFPSLRGACARPRLPKFPVPYG